MVSQASKENKRDLILEAAIQVFSAKGYHNTKMEEIAIAAGIGKGTIYEYFTGKLQLLQEIMERSFQLYYQTIDVNINKSLYIHELIKILAEGHIRFCQENKQLTRILFFDDIVDSELRDWACEKRRLKEEHMEDLLAEAVRKGEIREMNTKILSILISGIFTSFWAPIVIDGWDIDAAAAAEQVTEVIMQGIKNNPGNV